MEFSTGGMSSTHSPKLDGPWNCPDSLLDQFCQDMGKRNKAPYPYQRQNLRLFIDQIYRHHCGGVLGDDTSLGKTYNMLLITNFVLQYPMYTFHPERNRFPIPATYRPKVLLVLPAKNIFDPWQKELQTLYGGDQDLFQKRVFHFAGKHSEPFLLTAEFVSETEYVLVSYEGLLSQWNRYKLATHKEGKNPEKKTGDEGEETDRDGEGEGEEEVGNAPTLFHFFWETMVLDECHKIMNASINKSMKQGIAVYRAADHNAGTALLMSGTPLNNDVREFYSYARAAGAHKLWGQWEYWSTVFKDERQIMQSRDLFFFRTTREDEIARPVFKDLPPCLYKTVLCRQTQRQLECAQTLVTKGIHVLSTAPSPPPPPVPSSPLPSPTSSVHGEMLSPTTILLPSPKPGTSTSKPTFIFHLLRQWIDISASPYIATYDRMRPETIPTPEEFERHSSKIPPLRPILEQQVQGAARRQAIVFCHRIPMVELIQRWIKRFYPDLQPAILHSQSGTGVDHNDLLQRFAEPNSPIRVLVTTPKSVGEGKSLLTNVSLILFMDLDWNPNVEKQAVDRMNRIGQTRDMLVYRMIADGYSIDPLIRHIQCIKVNTVHPLARQEQKNMRYALLLSHDFTFEDQKRVLLEAKDLASTYDKTCTITEPFECFEDSDTRFRNERLWTRIYRPLESIPSDSQGGEGGTKATGSKLKKRKDTSSSSSSSSVVYKVPLSEYDDTDVFGLDSLQGHKSYPVSLLHPAFLTPVFYAGSSKRHKTMPNKSF